MNIKNFQVINNEFSLFLVGRMLFVAGTKIVPILLGWHLYELTNSKLILGFLGLSEIVPAILMSLPAGVKVDSSNKHNLILCCLACYYVAILSLAYVCNSHFTAGLDQSTIVTFIMVVVAITGFIRAYISPALSAFLAQLVNKEQLVKAANTNSMSWLMSAIFGQIIGGILLGIIGISYTFIFAAGMIFLAILIFFLIDPKPVMYKKTAGTVDSIVESLVFVFKNKPLFGAMGLDMFAVLFGGAVAMLPVFAKDILHVGETEYGILNSATFLGNFLALLYFNIWPLRHSQGRQMIVSVGMFGVCILIFGLSKNVYLSFLALFFSGIFDGVSVLVRGTIFQILVPDEMRGRVSSVNSIFINSSNELGQFESGIAASVMGTVPSVVFGGLMTMGISAFAYYKVSKLRQLEY